MKRTAVVSSNLAGVGYDAATRVLEVQFKGGGIYRYEGVAPEEHAELMAAESVGKCFAAGIKKRYEGKRVEE